MPTSVPRATPLLEFASRERSLWVNGAPLILKGINWYGFETEGEETPRLSHARLKAEGRAGASSRGIRHPAWYGLRTALMPLP